MMVFSWQPSITKIAVCQREPLLPWELRRSVCSTFVTSSWGTTVGCSYLQDRHSHLDILQAFQCQHVSKWAYHSPNLLFLQCFLFQRWSYYLQDNSVQRSWLSSLFPSTSNPKTCWLYYYFWSHLLSITIITFLVQSTFLIFSHNYYKNFASGVLGFCSLYFPHCKHSDLSKMELWLCHPPA